MEKHQSSYENIVLYSTYSTYSTASFTGTFHIAFGYVKPFTAITTTHWERGLLSYTLYSNLSSHAFCDVAGDVLYALSF